MNREHYKLKWLLKDEINMLTTDELYKVKKLIISFYDKEEKIYRKEIKERKVK